MMCMKQQQGNRQKTMCVASADVEKKEMQGRLTCGCCEDSLGACILPREDGETSEDGVDTSEDGEDDEEDEATSVDGAII